MYRHFINEFFPSAPQGPASLKFHQRWENFFALLSRERIKINNNWKKRKENFTPPKKEAERQRSVSFGKAFTFFLTHSAGFETCVLLTYVKIINFFRSSSSPIFLFCVYGISFHNVVIWTWLLLMCVCLPASFAITHTSMMKFYFFLHFFILIENLSNT
jgi:hypothetical protein